MTCVGCRSRRCRRDGRRASTPRAASPVARWADAPDHAWRAVDGAGTVRWQEMELVEARYLTRTRRCPGDDRSDRAAWGNGRLWGDRADGSNRGDRSDGRLMGVGRRHRQLPRRGGPAGGHPRLVRCRQPHSLPGAPRRRVGPRRSGEALAVGRRSGARFAYLQVREDNEAARGLYAAAGFTPHHAYAYRNPA